MYLNLFKEINYASSYCALRRRHIKSVNAVDYPSLASVLAFICQHTSEEHGRTHEVKLKVLDYT
jgi:hypothetical protein